MEIFANYVRNFIDNNSIREISVIINDSPPLARQLSIELMLECVREKFSNPDEELCIYDNMSFIGPNGEIGRIDEFKKSLRETLIGERGEILKIKKPLDYLDERAVINKYKLEYGLKISDHGPTHSGEKTFKLIKNQITIHKRYQNHYKSETCENSHEELCLKNSIAIANVNATLPWSPLSVGFSVSREHKNPMTKESGFSATYDVKYYARSMIKITKILPTDDFIKAVERALDSNDPCSELQEITKNFGEYVIWEIEVGGKEINIQHSSNFAQQETNTKVFKAGFKLSASNIASEVSRSREYGVSESNTLQETSTYSEVVGGDKNKYKKDDLKEWEDSLIDCTKWEIISYNKIEPIFSILDGQLRQKVIEIIMKKKILHVRKESISNLKFFSNHPYKHELKIPPALQSNLQNCQIFASIMNKEKHIFSVQVVHVSDGSASLLLHRISDNNKKKSECYNLQIGWIIVGCPNDFTNSMSEFKVKLSKTNTSNTIEIDKEQDSCLLASCAYKVPKESNNDPFETNTVTGVCFCENSTLKAFAYDLKSRQQKNHDMNTLSIHYSWIQVLSESCQTYFEFQKKKNFGYFEPFKGQSAYIYDIVNKHQKPSWKYDDNNDLVFFCLFSDNNNLGFACITPKHLFFKPLSTPLSDGPDKLQISRLRMCDLANRYK